jgi:putative MFS transporter
MSETRPPPDPNRIARLHWLPRRIHPPVPITVREEKLLVLVGAASVIATYDLSLYSLAVVKIKQDLGIAEEDIGAFNALFRLGVIPALVLSYLSDVIGRRLLLMVTLAGAALGTVLAGLSQNVWEFVAAQTIARVCIYTEELLVVVVIAEEFKERTRGWAIGALGAFGAVGGGLASAMYGLVDLLPFGWRFIYVVTAIPLIWLIWARSRLPETARFQDRKDAAKTDPWRWFRPAIGLATQYPGRMALLILTVVPFAFGMASAVFFFPTFLQKTHGWLPGQVAGLTLGGGVFVLFGAFAAGALSDIVGRKAVLIGSCLITVASFMVFYTVAEGWIALTLCWIAGYFTVIMADVLFQALGAELFPTSYRSVASGMREMFRVLAGAVGLVLQGQIFLQTGDHGSAVAWLMLVSPLAAIPVLFLPETASRSLETIAPERDGKNA